MIRPQDDIVVDFIYPPIPIRNFDYCAVWSNDEPNDDGWMLIGYGRNPLEAIIDLLDTTEIHDDA